jgi:hypothetical protein
MQTTRTMLLITVAIGLAEVSPPNALSAAPISSSAAPPAEAEPGLVPPLDMKPERRVRGDEPLAGASHGDLFPAPGHATAAAATGLPFYGIGEFGFGFTGGVAVGVIGGVTPSVWTVGLRPRFRVGIGSRTSLVLVAPILYYPEASAPGPGNIGSASWVLTRPELFLDEGVGNRWHLAGGMGIVAAAATEALGEALTGHKFAMPPYNGSPDPRHGFAGGVWNTVCARASFALSGSAHLFLESSLVLDGWVPADNVGGLPIVVTLGGQAAL